MTPIVAGRTDGSFKISSRLPKAEPPPRRNCTVRTARFWLAALEVGVRPMLIIRSSKQVPADPAPVQLPESGKKLARTSGTPEESRAKTILRPGQTEIEGARPD